MKVILLYSRIAVVGAIAALMFLGVIIRLLFPGEYISTIEKQRACLKAVTAKIKDPEELYKEVWNNLPRITEKCVFKNYRKSMRMFGVGMNSVYWMTSKVQASNHVCNIIFIRQDELIDTEREMMEELYPSQYCRMHIASPKVYSTKNETLILQMYRMRMYPKVLPYEEQSEIRRDKNKIDLIFFIMNFVRRYRIDSINVLVDGRQIIKGLYKDGPMEEMKIRTCQMNILYPRPKTTTDRREFYTLWNKLLADKRYMLTAVRHMNSTHSSFYLINYRDPYCWAKYLTVIEPYVGDGISAIPGKVLQ